MNGKFFLDTNVFVYSLDLASARKSRIATKLIHDGITTRKGVVSHQVIQEFFNVAFRKFATPMSVLEANRYLGSIFRPLLALPSFESLYSLGIAIVGEHQVSWYDALIIAAALESGCTILFSEDLQSGRKFGDLQIRNPFNQVM